MFFLLQSWRSGRSRSCLGALRSWRICKSCCTSPRRWRSGWLRLSTTCSIRYHPANICGTWHKILSYPKSNRQPDHPLLLVLVPVFPVRRAAERRRKKRPPGLLLLLLQPPCRPSLTVSMRYAVFHHTTYHQFPSNHLANYHPTYI